MSELISGKEALIAWYDGEEIEIKHKSTGWYKFNDHNFGIGVFKADEHQFRLKPRTITINGIEVPAPFKPKEGDLYWHISPEYMSGYGKSMYSDGNVDTWQQFGAWRTEEEIKQVVAALRSIFNAT